MVQVVIFILETVGWKVGRIKIEGITMIKGTTLFAVIIFTASAVLADSDLNILKSSIGPSDVLIYVKNEEIPASPRSVKGLYDQEKYGDWILDVSPFDAEQDARNTHIFASRITHIYTTDTGERGHVLYFNCLSVLASDGRKKYSAAAIIKSSISSNEKIKDFNNYYYILDNRDGDFQDSLRVNDKMISLGSTLSQTMNMINLFKNGREVSGMLDVNASKQVFNFSLKGFTRAYSEMKNRCLSFSYVTYNRVFR